MSFVDRSYSRQASHFQINDRELYERFELDSIDRWRHGRMYDSVLPLIQPEDSWLTVGDGRYGSDAFFLKQRGVNHVLPTDLSETLLEIGKAKGIIVDYRIENAENMSFEDGAFDWAFCKESYHHFPRPMIAVYEMLRVAREGLVLIEPNDGLIESRHLAGHWQGWEVFKRSLINLVKRKLKKQVYYPFGGYENAGNFIFTISRRELEKVALGIDLPWVAFKGLNDHYEIGYEAELATSDNPRFMDLKRKIAAADERVRKGKGPYALLTAVLGKKMLTKQMEDALKGAGYEVIHLPRNPYISSQV